MNQIPCSESGFLKPHISQESVYIPPKAASASNAVDHYHIFFVPGNPGCIAYYHTFLSQLSDGFPSQASRDRRRQIHVCGLSLANFAEGTTPRPGGQRRILGLQEQISYVEEMLNLYVTSRQRDWMEQSTEVPASEPVKIILIGHSVGAYICMELLRRWRARETKEGNLHSESSRIVGFIGLFPTITWIRRSPSGRTIGLLARLPHLAFVVGSVVRILTSILKQRILKVLVKRVTGFHDAAVKTTTDFLTSSVAVEQALFMARDEMREITEDRWDEDVWGVAKSMPKSPKSTLILYFGKNDHWVADHIRDDLIATRGSQGSEPEARKAKMLVDDMNVPHSFCIWHSSVIATKTGQFVNEIIDTDLENL